MAVAARVVLGGMVSIAAWCLPATAAADGPVDELRWQVYRHALAGAKQAALPAARELVAVTERVFGDDHPETADSLDALAGWTPAIRGSRKP